MVVAVVLVATAAIVKYKMLIQNRATTTFNNTCNVRQQAGWTAKSAASQQRCPFTKRYIFIKVWHENRQCIKR